MVRDNFCTNVWFCLQGMSVVICTQTPPLPRQTSPGTDYAGLISSALEMIVSMTVARSAGYPVLRRASGNGLTTTAVSIVIIVTSHERHVVSNPRQLRCLFIFFSLTKKKMSQFHITVPLWPVEAPHKGTVMRKASPRHGVVMVTLM